MPISSLSMELSSSIQFTQIIYIAYKVKCSAVNGTVLQLV